jgi:hypothetical protein
MPTIFDRVNSFGKSGKENPNYLDAVYPEKLSKTYLFGIDGPFGGNKYISIDASINLRHEAAVTVTQHPVEIGANISDFAIVEPRRFSLAGRISEAYPLKRGETFDPDDILKDLTGVRVQTAWEKLEFAMRNRWPIYIQCNLKDYPSMLITSLATNQDWRTARVLDFTASFQELITVSVTETQIKERQIKKGSSREQSSPTINRGYVQPSEFDATLSRDQGVILVGQ